MQKMSLRDQVIEKKQNQVKELTQDFSESDALFFTEYRGLTVSQLQEFRQTIKKSNAKYKVIKNSLIKRMFDGEKVECPNELLKGPTAVVISKQDCPNIASEMVKFVKDNEAFVIKGGYLDGAFISVNDVKALSKLPPREVLIGQLVGGLKSTISRFVMGVSSPIRGLVYTLEAIKNQK